MKVKFYIDCYEGMQKEYLSASTTPLFPKPDNARRYAFLVELPDPYFVDEELKPIKAVEIKGTNS